MSPARRYLATSLALVAVLLGWGAARWWEARPTLRPPARPTSPAIARSLPAAASARQILDQGGVLGLTPEQRARLEALDRERSRDTVGLERELEAAMEDFSRFMGDAQATRGVTLQEIQRRGSELSGMSAALRERRLRHAAVAAEVLTARQREQLVQITSQLIPGGSR